MSIRVLIVDDHGIVRAGLRSLLTGEPDVEIVGEAGDGTTALELAGELKPDVMLLDLSMPDMSGIQVTDRLKALLPSCRTLILTVHEDEGLLREAIQAGAAGYIIKRAAESDLIAAIHAVARGELYVHSALIRQLFENLPAPPASPAARLDLLTPREVEILNMLVRGYTNRQAADELAISIRTVEGHRASLMSKLGLRNRAELMSFAEEHDLLD